MPKHIQVRQACSGVVFIQINSEYKLIPVQPQHRRSLQGVDRARASTSAGGSCRQECFGAQPSHLTARMRTPVMRMSLAHRWHISMSAEALVIDKLGDCSMHEPKYCAIVGFLVSSRALRFDGRRPNPERMTPWPLPARAIPYVTTPACPRACKTCCDPVHPVRPLM